MEMVYLIFCLLFYCLASYIYIDIERMGYCLPGEGNVCLCIPFVVPVVRFLCAMAFV